MSDCRVNDAEACQVCGLQGCEARDPACQACNQEHAESVVCERCRRRVRKQILELPELYLHLYLTLEPSTMPSERVKGSRFSPLPLRGEVDALMWDVLGKLEAWEQDVNRRLGRPDEPSLRRRDGVAITAATNRLIPQVGLLCDDPVAGPVFVDELNDLHRRCRLTLGQTRGKDRLPARCPNLGCDQMALVRWHGSDQVDCEACGRVWSRKDYKRLCYVLAYEERQAQKEAG